MTIALNLGRIGMLESPRAHGCVSTIHHRFFGRQSVPGNPSETCGKKQTFLIAFRVTRKFSTRRSFALEQLSTNTKSTQHQTAEWARDRVLFNRSSRRAIYGCVRASAFRYWSMCEWGKLSCVQHVSFLEFQSSICNMKNFVKAHTHIGNKRILIFSYFCVFK